LKRSGDPEVSAENDLAPLATQGAVGAGGSRVYLGCRTFTAHAGELGITMEYATSGVAWGPSTIHGNADRGTGILNNELYVGRLIWNRLRFIKDHGRPCGNT